MKTIIYLHPHFVLPGGAGNFVLETGARLADKNNKIFIVTGKIDPKIIAPFKNKITFVETQIPISSSFKFRLLFPIRQKKIHQEIQKIYKQAKGECLLFPQVFPANRRGMNYKRKYPKMKTIFMCHEPSAFIHEKRRINAINNRVKKIIAKLINKWFKKKDCNLMKYADIILANSKFTAENSKRIYGRCDGIVYPGYDETRFFIKKEDKKENYFAVISRLTKFKRVDFLIDVYATFHKENPEIKLKIAGDGEDKKSLEDKVKKMRLEKNIEFLGRVNDDQIRDFFAKAQAVLFGSIGEPFGMVPIEAMACGASVVAHNSGGVKETVDPEFRYETEEEAVQIMQKIIEKQGKTVKDVSKFTWGHSVDALEKFL